ncbi:hypothetical protein [uncultured Draconibacterium sp.]|uniref:hypothetical protein n=1 Tax=uncultured Draconibacterium sp. TaxID=1573823 RepID=UPI003216A64C
MKSLIRKMSFAICTLLLACTFCFSLNAQEQPENKSVNSLIDSSKVVCDGDALITAKLLIKYVEECANDSIVHGCTIIYEKDTLPDNLGGYTIIGTQKVVDVYIPKEPTIKDFVRWVSKKYGL